MQVKNWERKNKIQPHTEKEKNCRWKISILVPHSTGTAFYSISGICTGMHCTDM